MSSPPGSPVPDDLQYPEELTPRTKIRQLLAQFDDSDDDTLPVGKSPAVPPTIENGGAVRQPNGPEASDSEADSEPVARKPVGRLAAAMKGVSNTSTGARSPTESPVSSPASQSHTNKAEATKTKAFKSIFGEDEVSTPSETPSTPAPRHAQNSDSQLNSKADKSLLRQASPGLFVSPGNDSLPRSRTSSISVSDSEDDNTVLQSSNQKLKELLARKKAERIAEKKALRKLEREREARRMEKLSSDAADLERIIASESDGDDAVAVRKSLTQQSRPARKASKKAIEEMNRETQRISREQHLAHQAKVKKTFTTSDFLQRFKSRLASNELPRPKSSDDEAKMSGALVSSDIENYGTKDTPPTSPINGGDDGSFKIPPGFNKHSAIPDGLDDDDLPTYEELKAMSSQPKIIAGQKEETIDSEAELKNVEVQNDSKKVSFKPKSVKVVLTAPHVGDSDDDLEIIDYKPAARAIFQSVPANIAREVNAHRDLRHLANLTSPSRNKPKAKGAMTILELNLKLGQKARQQALHDREERINEARARGIYIPTAEERERDQAEIVSIEKAREEAALLAKEERAKAKKDGTAEDNGFDDSEDEEFEYDADGDSDKSDTDDGGEEIDDELDEEDLFEEENEEAEPSNPFFDNEAEESCDEELPLEEVKEVQVPATIESPKRSPSESVFLKPALPRKSRHRKVVSDDEDEEDEQSPQADQTQATLGGDAFGAFGFNNMEDSLPGLSQAFAGTLNPIDSQASTLDPEQDSLACLRQLPPGSVPEFDNALLEQNFEPNSQRVFLESIRTAALPTVDLGLSQLTSQLVAESPSKAAEIQLTQDVGFAEPRVAGAPGLKPIPSTSTIGTLLLPSQESPILKRRSKLRRKTSIVAVLSESEKEDDVIEEDDPQSEDDANEAPKDALDLIFQNARKQKKVEDFNKKRSRAKGLVEEHAEESEDEYKGLGGASDDESEGEMNEEDAKMIDEGPVKVDERKLAAFHADKERKSDEKQLNKLYKDITTGALRKKRGGDFDDLDDSDDELIERRRRKQEEFARMRRALLADERVGKIGKCVVCASKVLY
jgi:mediator of replication checkpoint protein 1